MHHLKYLRLINILYGILLVLVGLGVVGLGIFLGLLAPEGQGGANPGVPMLAGSIFGAVLIFVGAALHFAVARRVENGQGRLLQTILVVFNIGNVPLGTAYGIYALWVCYMNEETKHMFT